MSNEQQDIEKDISKINREIGIWLDIKKQTIADLKNQIRYASIAIDKADHELDILRKAKNSTQHQ